MVRWFKGAVAPVTVTEFETQQEKLRRLSGAVMDRYQKELAAEISDPQRLAAVYGAAFATAGARRQAEVVAKMATSMLRVPHALVSIVTGTAQEIIAAVHADGDYFDSMPITDSWCQHVIGTGREMAIENSAEHPLVCNTSAARNGEVVSYLGVPIASREGIIVGVLCVYDSRERDWQMGDVGLLTQLSVVLTRSL